jgi:signal transduction histidine kinase
VGARREGRFSMADLVAIRAVARRAAVDHLRAVAHAGQRQLGRVLHDSFGQTLTSIVFGLQDLEHVVETDGQRALARQVRAHARTALDQLRHVIDVAMASGRQPRGQILDLVELARRFAGSDVTVRVVNRLGRGSLPDDIARCLRQVAREALLNIRRHAKARTVRLTATRRRQWLTLAISDDGRGFSMRRRKHRAWGGSGLAIIRERVDALDGILRFQSIPGKGTRLSVSLPCPR